MNRAIASAALLALIFAPLAVAHGQTGPAAAPSAGSTAPASGEGTAPAPVTRGEVKNVQRELQTEGLYKGKIDGVVGPQTKEALSTYQKDHGLPQTAMIDQQTKQRIGGPKGRRAWRAGK
jgi:peptidoglycan hydrolase-like protein with peptidoglycan-binding domain